MIFSEMLYTLRKQKMLINNDSMTVKDKTFRLTLRIIETVLKVLKQKGIQKYVPYLSDRMGVSKSNIVRMLDCDGEFNIKTLVKLLDAADLEIEIKFYDRSTKRPIEHIQVSTIQLDQN